jgi:hypothetical protein
VTPKANTSVSKIETRNNKQPSAPALRSSTRHSGLSPPEPDSKKKDAQIKKEEMANAAIEKEAPPDPTTTKSGTAAPTLERGVSKKRELSAILIGEQSYNSQYQRSQ